MPRRQHDPAKSCAAAAYAFVHVRNGPRSCAPVLCESSGQLANTETTARMDSELGCALFGSCSGCQVQDRLSQPPLYHEAKRDFGRLGLMEFPSVMQAVHGWRCRAKLAVRGETGRPLIGLFRQGSHEVVDILGQPSTAVARVRGAASGARPRAARPPSRRPYLFARTACRTGSPVARRPCLPGRTTARPRPAVRGAALLTLPPRPPGRSERLAGRRGRPAKRASCRAVPRAPPAHQPSCGAHPSGAIAAGRVSAGLRVREAPRHAAG
jgi:hypothetical protein